MQLSPYADAACMTFVRRIGEGIFTGPEFRITLLLGDSPDAVRPAYRREPGASEVKRIDDSDIVFKRGMPVAGLALEQPGGIFVLTLPALADAEAARRLFQDALGLPEDLAASLSRSETMRRTKQILCVAIPGPALPIVLSVDSLVADGVGAVDGDNLRLKYLKELSREIEYFANALTEQTLRDRP
jgi:hypothetical protein